jgi:hypothetical protein
MRFTHPKGPSGLLPPKAAENSSAEGDPNLFWGEESASPPRAGAIQSRACARRAAAEFSAWRDCKLEFSRAEKINEIVRK